VNKLVIEVIEPDVKGHEKFAQAIEVLGKATGVEVTFDHAHPASEPSPYRALRELDAGIKQDIAAGLSMMLDEISSKWLGLAVLKAVGDDLFKLDGKFMLNPKTGGMLTVKEWEEITGHLDRSFSHLFGRNKEALTKQAIAAGKILQTMTPVDRIDTPLPVIQDQVDAFLAGVGPDSLYNGILDYAEIHTGELIQDITSANRRRVMNKILEGYNNSWSTRELQSELFDSFSEINRDWRRIAETETATNFNNGYLIAELDTKAAPGDTVFMKGITAGGACGWCADHVDDTIVVLLEDAPGAGDQVEVDGKTYTAIWPGKNNFGRKRRDWWIASGSQHPHCRCTWTRYSPGMEKYYDMLNDALDKQTKKLGGSP